MGENASQGNREESRPDYRDEDGLLVCGRCGKRKERRFPPMLGRDEPLVVTVMCDCQVKAEREEREKAERRAAQARADRLRRECFPNGGFYRDLRFSADDGRSPAQSSLCQRYAATFDGKDSAGLLLWGDVGTGKSFMSACIANAVIDMGFSALCTDIGYIVTVMESSFEDRRKNLDRILAHDLLLIEDLGVQRSSGYMMEHVYNVIDGRYKSGKPMVITTNFSLQEMSSCERGNPWNRIFDRILERCYPVEFTGPSRRRRNVIGMRESMRARLGIE